jgi:hypothetical protein
MSGFKFLIVGLATIFVGQAKAESAFNCIINVLGAETAVTGYRWLGHGIHYSIKPYSLEHKGQTYKIEATFYTFDGTKVVGEDLSVESEGFTARGKGKVTLTSPNAPWPGVSVECKLDQ